jgi:hypothetical protein
MNFLTPLFLIGGLAVAGPIIFHLIKRTTRERMVFSSLMFLLPTPPRLSKRSKLEHWLLLLLRCLALGLLALGFSRPFFKQTPLDDPTAAPPKRIVVLLDISASMRRTGVWDAARQRVDATLAKAAPADQVALYTFDRAATPLLAFDEWNRTAASDRPSLAKSRLAVVSPGWSGTQLGNALITAAEALAENDGKQLAGSREIVLVSDLQAGSRLDALQAYEWPKGVSLVVEAIKARNPTNAGLQLVADNSDRTKSSDTTVVRVRVSNAADAQREQFKVGWSRATTPGEFASATVDVYVPPGQSRVVAVPLPKDPTGLDRIVLKGDDEDFDNTVFVIPPAQQRLNVLWLGAEAADDARQPLFFLRRALSDTPRLAVNVIARNPSAPLLPGDIDPANVVFVSDALPAGQGTALREQALAGKTVIVAAKDPSVAPTLGALFARDVTLTEVKPASYAMFAEIDFTHPLFAPFSDPRFSDFTKIHIWKYRKLDPAAIPGARVLARLDSGDPLLIEAPLGKGRVLILTSSWQPDDSQLSVSTKFVPLLWSLLELGGGVSTAPSQWFVGDTAPLPPGGTDKEIRFTEPGIREVKVGERSVRFAVNLEANESRTTPLSPDELERLGVPVTQAAPKAAQSADNKVVLLGVEAENRQKLWRWFIAATLAVLLVESALAGWAARKLNSKTQEAAT